MKYFDSMEKKLNALKEEYILLSEYKNTYTEVLPEIGRLLDQLFEESTVKDLGNYEYLKTNYYDQIKGILNPSSYRQLKVEVQIPNLYDPPSVRNKKVPSIVAKKKVSPIKKTGSKEPSTGSKEPSTGSKEPSTNGDDSKEPSNVYQPPKPSKVTPKANPYPEWEKNTTGVTKVPNIKKSNPTPQPNLPTPPLYEVNIDNQVYYLEMDSGTLYNNGGLVAGHLKEDQFVLKDGTTIQFGETSEIADLSNNCREVYQGKDGNYRELGTQTQGSMSLNYQIFQSGLGILIN